MGLVGREGRQANSPALRLLLLAARFHYASLPLPPAPPPCPCPCLQRSALSEAQLREEVAALQHQGHRRLLVLTGEHPRYTFDEFLKAIDVISSGGCWCRYWLDGCWCG